MKDIKGMNKKIKINMTFREFMQENGYELKTTFWDDFTIADRFGENAVQDTYNRAFAEWKSNHIYLTELAMVLNHKIWQYHQSNESLARLYDKLWRECDTWAIDNLEGKELEYYIYTTD